LNEVADIDNVIDKAIIKAFEYLKGKRISGSGLTAGAIKDIVRDKFLINKDEDIQSRIRVLYKREILVEVKPSQPRKDTKRIYALNEDIEFNFVCGLLPVEVGSKEIPMEIRRHHTVELQDAIKQWIAYFPEPSADYPFDQASRYQDDVHECQSHTLFPDLENHLPEMGYGVWNEWRRYKESLLKLQENKKSLLYLIENDIAKCFIGIQLKFISDLEYGIRNYECHLLPNILYNLLLDLSGRVPGQVAYDNYEKYISDFRENTAIEDRGSMVWKIKGSDELIMVPKEKREALEKGINNCLNLLENIEKPNLIKQGEEIVKKVKDLKNDRAIMMKELDDILQYHSFPGECKYLSGF
jgi:hypothetical protein